MTTQQIDAAIARKYRKTCTIEFRNRARQPQCDAKPIGKTILGMCGTLYRRYTNGMIRKVSYATSSATDSFIRMNPVVSRSKYMPNAA